MLPAAVTTYLRAAAESAGVAAPGPETPLFEAGILDSFALVDFVALLEQQCGIRVPDHELRPANFESLARIEAFVAGRS